MSVYLDEQLVELPGATIGELVNAAQAKAAEGGRMVVEVKIDGALLSADDLADRQHESLAGDLALATSTAQQVALDAIEDAKQRVAAAGELQEQAGELLQEDKPTEAIELIVDALACWQQVQQTVLQVTEVLQVKLDNIDVEGRPMSQFVLEAVQQFKELRNVLEAKDTVAIADMMSYEWPDIASQWRAALEALAQSVRESK